MKERYTSGQDALTDAEVKSLLHAITRLEDDALLRFAIVTGMRREDVVGVKLHDLDLETGIVKFWQSKKRMPWRAWVGDGEAARILALHIEKLPKGTPWLFPSPRNPKNHLSSRQAYNILQKWLDRAGVKRRPFHALRATCVKLAQKRGLSIEWVMSQTGDTFRTIKEHYDTPSDEEMAQAVRENPIL